MINKEQAIEIVKGVISGYELPDDDKCIILNTETIEKEWGWVFFIRQKNGIKQMI